MRVLSFSIVKQVAQQRNNNAQGVTRVVGLAIWPQEGRQLAARMHATFDRQVEQQGLRLAQSKRETPAVMKHFGSAEHGQTKQTHDMFPSSSRGRTADAHT